MTIEGLTKYLKESGLEDRFSNLKPGDSFGVEIPINEENDKWLRFWLSAEGSTDVEHITVDFEGMVTVRVCCDEKKLEDWVDNSGITELFGLTESMAKTDEQEEKM